MTEQKLRQFIDGETFEGEGGLFIDPSLVQIKEPLRPVCVMFFPNGMAAVFDQYGQQMSKYQGAGKHPEVIAALKADGYDWQDLRDDGSPLRHGEFVDNLGRPMPAEDQ